MLGRRHGEADLLFPDECGGRRRATIVVRRRALTRETVLAVHDPPALASPPCPRSRWA
ncbi:hypothetical protein ACWHAO_25350 [Streptomyces albidoflavus]